MPLPEFYRMGKGKIEAPQQRSTPSSTDLSFLGDNELVELVWENGQIMMQGQSNKGRKSPLSSTTSKIGKFGTTESIFNDFGVSDDMVLSHEDEMVRWLNYPVDDNLQPDYCSEILPELSGVTVNEPSTRNNFTLIDKRDRFNHTVRDSSSFGSGISDPFSSNTSTRHHHGHVSLAGFPHMKMQKQDYGVPTSNSNLLNFSHFSRPAANARANLENIVALPDSGLLRMGDKDKGSATSISHPPKFTPIDSNNQLQEEMSLTMPDEEPCPSQQSGAICRENVIRNDNSLNQDLSTTKGALESEKVVEPVVASSSVCSANSVERTSNDLMYNLKRKSRDFEESEWQSEDIEEESVGVGVKKVACARGGTSSKRSRAAEVHNLSERRRRDRINEKMRALQELIPNCNKVDKASMLDEAIEYLKTLQLQVQMMSMGAGLYMPPMMLPTGMQHIHGTHLPHFSMGMGMRMGYGIGMQGAHFHHQQQISGPASFQGLAGSDLRVFGYPAQGLPMSGSVPLPARPPLNSGTGLNASRTGTCVEVSNASPSLNPNDPVAHSNTTQVMRNGGASSSMPETSSQKNDQGPEVGSSADVKSTNANESVSITAAGND